MNIAKIVLASLFAVSVSGAALAANVDQRLAGAQRLFVLDDVTLSIITGDDSDGMRAITKFRGSEGHRTLREITAAAIPDINKAEPLEVIANRRDLASKSEFWVMPFSIVSVQGNSPSTRGRLVLQGPSFSRVSGTGEDGEGRTHVCTEFTGKPACVRVVNLNVSEGKLYPKWIDIGASEVASLKIRDENIMLAMIVKPVSQEPKVILGRSTVDVEVVQWALVDSNYGAIKLKFNHIQSTGRTTNPWIGF